MMLVNCLVVVNAVQIHQKIVLDASINIDSVVIECLLVLLPETADSISHIIESHCTCSVTNNDKGERLF